jgi:hypothetical protein
MLTTIATTEASLAVNSSLDNTRSAAGTVGTYGELGRDLTGAASYEADVLVQLKSNIAQLEDLHARMHFMMNELSYLLRKS